MIGPGSDKNEWVIHLFPVFPNTLPKGLLAGESIIEGGYAAFVTDNSTGDTLDAMPGVQAFPRQVTALDAARRRHKDVSRRRRRLAPVDRAKSVWRARLGAVVR